VLEILRSRVVISIWNCYFQFWCMLSLVL